MSGSVIGRLEVSSGAAGIAGLANSRRAGSRLARGRQDGKAVLGEFRVGAHVDAGQIPEDGVGGLGVLELEHVGLVRGGGQLDGDTTAVGVGAPALGEGATVGGEGLHGTDVAGDGPGIDVLIEVVGNQHGATGGHGVVTSSQLHARGKGRGQSGEGSGKAESLGEHHFDNEGVRLEVLCLRDLQLKRRSGRQTKGVQRESISRKRRRVEESERASSKRECAGQDQKKGLVDVRRGLYISLEGDPMPSRLRSGTD